MIVGIDKNKEEIIKKEVEKEYDGIYRKFIKTKGALKRKSNTKKMIKAFSLAYVLGLAFLFAIGSWFWIARYLVLVLIFPFIYVKYIQAKDKNLDNHVNRMLISRVSKDIEYKVYPFMFDKEFFLRLTKHTYLPQVEYSKEIVVEDKEKNLVYRNIELISYPSFGRTANGMFAYVEIPNANYPRLVIKKTCEKRDPTLDDENEFKYYFDVVGHGDDFEALKRKILDSDFMERLKVYSRHFPSATIIIDQNIISAYFFKTYYTSDVLNELDSNVTWYSYQYGKEIMESCYDEDGYVDGSEYFLKTNKNYNRFNYYRWFGPIKIVEELTKII